MFNWNSSCSLFSLQPVTAYMQTEKAVSSILMLFNLAICDSLDCDAVTMIRVVVVVIKMVAIKMVANSDGTGEVMKRSVMMAVVVVVFWLIMVPVYTISMR